MHGQGIQYHTEGTVYNGSWMCGYRSGYGVELFPDGSRYVGNWLAGKRHGKGVLIDAQGQEIEGEWVKGSLVKTGMGTMRVAGNLISVQGSMSLDTTELKLMLSTVPRTHVFNASACDYIVREQLRFQRRNAFDQDLTKALSNRFHKRLRIHPQDSDKSDNSIAAVSGTPGGGKSAAIVHYFESKEYQAYAALRRECAVSDLKVSSEPAIGIPVTFNSAMGRISGESVLGLRLIFSVLRNANILPERSPHLAWQNFYARFGYLSGLSGGAAVSLIREVMGRDRLICIMVDEIGKSDDSIVMNELGFILDTDGRADVVVTALTPSYIEKLVSGSQRVVDYIIPPPLTAEIPEYTPLANQMVKQYQMDMTREGRKASPFLINVIHSAPLLASGHPRTLATLVERAQSGSFWADIKPHVDENVVTFIESLSKLHFFRMWSWPVGTNDEADIILSKAGRYVASTSPADTLFREMLEKKMAFVHEQIEEGVFVPTTSLSAFFIALDMWKSQDDTTLSYLSLAAKRLFQNVYNISTMWERACALSIVAQAALLTTDSHGARVNKLFDIPEFNVPGRVDGDLRLHFPGPNDTVLWRSGTLVVGPPEQAGWDFLLCARSEMYIPLFVYNEIKIAEPRQSLPNMYGEKIRWILEDHISNRVNGSNWNEMDVFSSVQIVFSVYPRADSTVDFSSLKIQVQDELVTRILNIDRTVEGWEIKKHQLQRAERYVDQYFESNVRVMSLANITKATIPVVLPIARLVQAVMK